jgi:hypothetical protein
MSAQTTATARTLSLPLRSPIPQAAPKKAGSLRLVPQGRSSAAKAPFVVVLVSLLVGGLLGLLLLNTLVAQGSFRLHDLSTKGKALEQRQQDLQRQVQALQAPGELAHRAAVLGMVPGNAPAFLRLSDGKVLGVATAGAAPGLPAAPTSPAATTTATKPAGPAASTTWTAPRPSPPPAAAAKPVTKPVTKPGTKPGTKPHTTTSAGTTTGAHR